MAELTDDPAAIVVFQDEAHFQVTTSVTRKWVPKGSKPKVKSAPGRKSVPYSGYVVPATGQLLVTPWHKKAIRLVQTEACPEYQDIRDRMVLVPLPPYSPDLNPMEQCWRITRREVTHNVYHPNVDALESNLDAYFINYCEPNEKFSSLCSFNWHN